MCVINRIDAHAHVLQYGESVSSVDLVGAGSVAGSSQQASPHLHVGRRLTFFWV